MAPKEPPATSMISSNDNKGPAVLGAVLSVVVVATLLVFARLYARGRLLKRYFLDDFFVILVLACAWIAVGFQIAAVKHGFGRHIYTLTPSQRTLAIKYQTIAYVPGIISSSIPKLAVVALLTRVFANTASRWHRAFLWVMAITCNIFMAIVAAFVLLQCRPLEMLWDPSTVGSCWKRDIQIRIAMSASVFSAVVDLYLAVYPTIVLTVLRIGCIKKFMLSFALGFGFISAIVAAYKATLIPKLGSPDMTYAVAELSIWTIVEGCTVTIATTIPVLQPVVYRLFGDGVLGSKRRHDHVPQHHFHERIGGGSDETHVGPVRQYEPPEYMDEGVFITKTSSILHPAHTNDVKTSHLERQKSRQSFEGVSASDSSGTAVVTYPSTTYPFSRSIRRPRPDEIELMERRQGILRTHEVRMRIEETDTSLQNLEPRQSTDSRPRLGHAVQHRRLKARRRPLEGYDDGASPEATSREGRGIQ